MIKIISRDSSGRRVVLFVEKREPRMSTRASVTSAPEPVRPRPTFTGVIELRRPMPNAASRTGTLGKFVGYEKCASDSRGKARGRKPRLEIDERVSVRYLAAA